MPEPQRTPPVSIATQEAPTKLDRTAKAVEWAVALQSQQRELDALLTLFSEEQRQHLEEQRRRLRKLANEHAYKLEQAALQGAPGLNDGDGRANSGILKAQGDTDGNPAGIGEEGTMPQEPAGAAPGASGSAASATSRTESLKDQSKNGNQYDTQKHAQLELESSPRLNDPDTNMAAKLSNTSSDAEEGATPAPGDGRRSPTRGATTHVHDMFDNLYHEDTGLRSIASHYGLLGTWARIIRCTQRHYFPRGINQMAKQLAEGKRFSVFVTFVIVLNAAFIAVTADEYMRRCIDYYNGDKTGEFQDQPFWIWLVDLIFACVFTAELLLRLVAEELRFFFSVDEWRWNLMDLVVVLTAWMEVIASFLPETSSGADVSFLRIFRMLRVIRSARLIRVLHFFREMRLILLSLMSCLVPLLWALLCLGLIVFAFSVLLLQGVAGYMEESNFELAAVDPEILIGHFQSFLRTFLTLIMAITGGDDWSTIHKPLEEASPVYGTLFVFYIAIMVFGVLNVITGIFVEGAIQKARSDRELAMAAEMEKNTSMMKQLMRLFSELDENQSNTVSFEEWERFTSRKDAKAALALLDLDVAKTNDIFSLIDLDNSSEVDLREFVVGCMQLQGSAKMVDVETLLRNNKKLMIKCTEHFTKVEQHIEQNMAERDAAMQNRLAKTDGALSSLQASMTHLLLKVTGPKWV